MAWFGLGCDHADRKENADAVSCFKRALETDPNHAEAWHNLGVQLHEVGRADEAHKAWRRALKLSDKLGTLQAIAITIPGSPNADHNTVREARRQFVKAHHPSTSSWPTQAPKRAGDGLFRIGYISSFFNKSNWMKPVWGLINAHDRQRFQIHLFSDTPVDSLSDGYLRHEGDQLHEITDFDNEDLPNYIEKTQIDLLVDLNSYSDAKRLPLFFRRFPIPVVAWFNLYATSALPAIDYLVGDRCVILSDEQEAYTERIHCLEQSYLTFQPDSNAPPVSLAPYESNGYVTFGSLCSQYKITEPVLDAWAAILRALPASRLLIRNATIANPGNQTWLTKQFVQRGAKADQLILLGPAGHTEFIRTYDRIDIALDTFPYSGGTTTMEALWQGACVITHRGDRWAARTTATLLETAGLERWVANDARKYIELAVALGADPNAHSLADQRQRQRAQLSRSLVCDSAQLAREMESFYEGILS